MRAFVAKFILRITSLLPLPLVHLLGGALAWPLIWFDNKTRSTTRTNIALCFPELPAEQQEKLLRQCLRETCKTFFESGILWLGSRQRFDGLIKDVRGEEHIQAALARGKGIVFVVPHLGSWETVGLYCSAHYPMTSLYRPPRLSGVDDMIRRARERNGAILVPTSAQGVKSLFQALKNNGVTGILPDQDPRDNGGHFAPFFGIQANTMVLLSRLVQKTGAVPILGYAERLPGGQGFRLHFEVGPEAIGSRDLDESVTAVNAMVEQAVRKLPEQYQWGYKRFRTRPPGEPWLY